MISITITGNLTDDPRVFTTRDGQPGCELRVAVDLPPRSGSGDGPTRYFKVVTFGVLASHAAASVHKGDRVTVQGYDLTSEAWTSDSGEPRSKVAIRAIEVAVSLRWDTLTTGRAVRNASRDAARAADPQVRAERAVLAGVTAS
jgi:single-strand DNA-binding protein